MAGGLYWDVRHAAPRAGTDGAGRVTVSDRKHLEVYHNSYHKFAARLENGSGELHRVIPKHFLAQSIQRLPAAECRSM